MKIKKYKVMDDFSGDITFSNIKQINFHIPIY